MKSIEFDFLKTLNVSDLRLILSLNDYKDILSLSREHKSDFERFKIYDTTLTKGCGYIIIKINNFYLSNKFNKNEDASLIINIHNDYRKKMIEISDVSIVNDFHNDVFHLNIFKHDDSIYKNLNDVQIKNKNCGKKFIYTLIFDEKKLEFEKLKEQQVLVNNIINIIYQKMTDEKFTNNFKQIFKCEFDFNKIFDVYNIFEILISFAKKYDLNILSKFIYDISLPYLYVYIISDFKNDDLFKSIIITCFNIIKFNDISKSNIELLSNQTNKIYEKFNIK